MKKNMFGIPNIIFDEYSQHIGEHATLVYLFLARQAKKDNSCFPSINLIAKKCSISSTTVKKALKTLVEHKLISIEKRTLDNGGKTSSLYTLLPL